MEKTGFLEESPGKRSSMRLMSMFALFAAIAFGGLTMIRSAHIVQNNEGRITIIQTPRDDTGLTITFSFLLAAFAPKALQKFAEQKMPTVVNSPDTQVNVVNPQTTFSTGFEPQAPFEPGTAMHSRERMKNGRDELNQSPQARLLRLQQEGL